MTDTNPSLVGGVTRISQALIGSLPPAFLILVLMNTAFLGGILWFLDSQNEQRVLLVKTVVEKCFENVKVK